MLPERRAECKSGLPRLIVITLALSSLVALCRASAAHSNGHFESFESYAKSSTEQEAQTSADAVDMSELLDNSAYDKILFDSSRTTPSTICMCHPCRTDRTLYAVIVTTGATCLLLGMLGSYLLFRRETSLIVKSLSLKAQASVRRQSSLLKPGGVSTTESTTSSVLVKMLKGMKPATQQTKNGYENEMKCIRKIQIF